MLDIFNVKCDWYICMLNDACYMCVMMMLENACLLLDVITMMIPY
jgi:hypothetical protein